MKIRNLHGKEKEELYNLLARSFQKDPKKIPLSKDYYKEIIESDPFFKLQFNKVIEIGGRLAARVGIYDRMMYYKGTQLRVGAIGGVCTAPEHRGKGMAKRLLLHSTDFMRKHNFDISLLFGEPALYGKYDWCTLSAFGISSNFKIIFPDSYKVNIRTMNWDKDIPYISTIYNSFNSNLNGPFVRSEKYWRTWIKHAVCRRRRADIYIVEKDETIYGYYALKSFNTVCEFVWDRTIPNAFETLMHTLFHKLKAEKVVSFTFFLPEIFDFLSIHSQPPSLEEMRKHDFFVMKNAIYSGLVKLINRTHPLLKTVNSSQSLTSFLRRNNYIFWDLDHF